ncbi:MAG TPA: response regulator, partial [Planctomycetaceae bacterium]|nr:response regulator [Planctomycetaceae bacterium]
MTSERTHILIVDDEPGMLRAVKKIFQRNHEITTAESGEDALEKLAQCAPDLAIVDVRMPGINGFELTRRLKQHDPHLDVILMTGNAEEPDDNLIKAIDGGAFYFIQKPFDRRVVITLVNRCLELRRLRNAELRYVNRLEQELDEAQQFQLSLLPPPFQHIAGVNIHARYLACSELAGDIYDYAPAGQDAVAFMVADVVGHGASAAMMTSVVKSAFHA